MSWPVILTETALEGLDDAERDLVSAELFLWVENGPPRRNRRQLRGLEVFEDELPSGYRLAYFINEAAHYVAILRVRKLV